MTVPKIGVDPDCVVLARHFLHDDGNITEARLRSLSEAIQQAVEDWFAMQPDAASQQQEERQG